MEWEINNTFISAVDGYDGYEFHGYLDGYLSDENYLQESVFALSIADVYSLKNTVYAKYNYYTSIESPSDKITRRILRLSQMKTRFDGIIAGLVRDGYDGY